MSPELNGSDPVFNSWTPINLALLEDQPPVRPTLGNVGIVYPGKRHVFSGSQESAKTLAAYAIGLEVVRQGGRVLVIDFEMGQWDARNRLRELGATPEDLADIPYVEPHEPATPDTMAYLAAWAVPDLVIIDAAAGAYDLQGLDDNKRQDAERVARLYIHHFWRNGIATLMIDHVVKQQGGAGKYAIGSERKTGGADVHLGFETIVPIQRGTQGLYKIVTHKDRGGFLQRGLLAHLELHSDPETHRITWKFIPAEHDQPEQPRLPTLLMERASKYLEKQEEPVSRNQVIRNTKGNDTYLGKALDALTDLRYATETEGERGAKLLVSTRPFRKKEWENEASNVAPPPLPPTSADFRQSGGQSTSATSASPSRGGEGTEADMRRKKSATSANENGGSQTALAYLDRDPGPELVPVPDDAPDPDDDVPL